MSPMYNEFPAQNPMLQRMQNMRQTFAQPFLSGGQFQRLQALEADAQRNPQGFGRFNAAAAYEPPAELEARARELQSQMDNIPGRRELNEYAENFRNRQPTAEEQAKLQSMGEAVQNNPQLRQLQSQFDQLQQSNRQQQMQQMQQMQPQSPGVNVNSGAPYGPYEQFQDQMFQQQQQARFNPYQQFQQQQQFNPYQQFQQQQQFNPYQQQQGMGIMGLLGGMPQAYGYNPMQGNFMGGFGYGGGMPQGGFGGGFGGQQGGFGGGFGGQQMFGGGFGGGQQGFGGGFGGGFGQPQPTAQASPFGGGFGGGFGSRGYNNAFGGFGGQQGGFGNFGGFGGQQGGFGGGGGGFF